MTFEVLHEELIKSMKEKNKPRKTVIADIIACAKNIAIEKGCKENITEEIVTTAILKSKKICQEMIDTCPSQRPDILEAYNLRMNYINELAPKMMNYEEVFDFINNKFKNKIKLTKATIMPIAIRSLKGKAEGKIINQAVNAYLKNKA